MQPLVDQPTARTRLHRKRRLDEKIRKLDEQLAQHKVKIKSTRGPAQEAAKRRALAVLKQKRLYEGQRDQLYNQQFNVEQTAFAMTSMQARGPRRRRDAAGAGGVRCMARTACARGGGGGVSGAACVSKRAPGLTRHLPLPCRPPAVLPLQDTVQTVGAMKAAGKEMKGFMKARGWGLRAGAGGDLLWAGHHTQLARGALRERTARAGHVPARASAAVAPNCCSLHPTAAAYIPSARACCQANDLKIENIEKLHDDMSDMLVGAR